MAVHEKIAVFLGSKKMLNAVPIKLLTPQGVTALKAARHGTRYEIADKKVMGFPSA